MRGDDDHKVSGEIETAGKNTATKLGKDRWHEKALAFPVVQRWPGGMSNGKERDFSKMSRLAGKL